MNGETAIIMFFSFLISAYISTNNKLHKLKACGILLLFALVGGGYFYFLDRDITRIVEYQIIWLIGILYTLLFRKEKM